MGNLAPEAVPLRIVVRFGPGLDQSFARACSVDVTPAGDSELTVGLNTVFRAAPTRLYTWNLDAGSTPANGVLTANNPNP
jgi:hypothetical protein